MNQSPNPWTMLLNPLVVKDAVETLNRVTTVSAANELLTQEEAQNEREYVALQPKKQYNFKEGRDYKLSNH